MPKNNGSKQAGGTPGKPVQAQQTKSGKTHGAMKRPSGKKN